MPVARAERPVAVRSASVTVSGPALPSRRPRGPASALSGRPRSGCLRRLLWHLRLRRDHMSLSMTLSERVVLCARAAYLVRSSGMWCAPEQDTVPFLSFLSVLSYYLCTPPAWWEEGKHVARHL